MRTEQNEKTIVILRKWPDGDVIALFPEIPADNTGLCCLSYELCGEHGAASAWHVIRKTKLATPAEYADTKAALEKRGYELVIRKRVTAAMDDARHRAAAAAAKSQIFIREDAIWK